MVVFLKRKHRVIIPFHHLPRKYSLMHLSLPARPSPFVFSLCPLSEERYAPSVCPGEADVYMIVTKNKLQKDYFQIIELCFYCLFIFICVSLKKTQEARFDTFQQLMASQCVQDYALSEVPMLTEYPACLESACLKAEECTTIYCAPLYSTLADVKQGPTLLEECAENAHPCWILFAVTHLIFTQFVGCTQAVLAFSQSSLLALYPFVLLAVVFPLEFNDMYHHQIRGVCWNTNLQCYTPLAVEGVLTASVVDCCLLCVSEGLSLALRHPMIGSKTPVLAVEAVLANI